MYAHVSNRTELLDRPSKIDFQGRRPLTGGAGEGGGATRCYLGRLQVPYGTLGDGAVELQQMIIGTRDGLKYGR